MKFMRSDSLFLLTLLILAACSKPTATQIFATETATVTTPAPSPSPEPSKTPEPSPTPDLRFKELLPETLKKCMNENVINWENRDADLALLIKKIKEKSVLPHKLEAFGSMPGSSGNNYVNIAWPEDNGVIISACAGLKPPNGEISPVYILPIRRHPSETIDYLAFAYPLPWEGFYQRIKQGKVMMISFNIILTRNKFPEGLQFKPWKNFLSLIPDEPAEAEQYSQNLKDYFDPDHTPFPEEKMNMLRSFINGRIFVCNDLIIRYKPD